MILYHLDEHVPRAIADGLRRRGIDVSTTVEAGLRSATDEAHLAYARAQGRVMVTCDRDFPHSPGFSGDVSILPEYACSFNTLPSSCLIRANDI